MRTKAIGPGEERERDGGDSSDSSLEEISEAYFNNNNRRRRRRFHGAGRDARSRVWPAAEDGGTKRRPPYPPHSHILPGSNYTSNLYNFAWAQAVQNKPLGFADAAAVPPDDNDDRVPDSVPPDGETSDGAVVEEGELEEGEIDDLEFLGESKCDSPVSPVLLEVEEDREVVDVGTSGPINEDDQNKMNADNNNNNNNDDDDIVEDAGIGNDGEITGNEEEEEEEEDDGDGNMDNLDMRVISVLEELETISEEDAEKSFQGACSRLTTALDDLQKMILKGHLHVLDAVIQQAFFALQTIHSVFLKGQEKNKDVYCRLLASVKGQKPLVFASSEHLKEIDSMIQALGSEYANKFAQVPLSVSNLTISNVGNAENITCHSSKLHALPPIVVPRSRKDYIPLLDPHVDHEESSLPSPTSHCATPSLLPRATTVHFGDSTTLQPTSCKQDVSNGNTILPYVTDAVTAVSSYQQKYNYIPCLSNNQLPSPTPSEESNDKFGDCNGEVSSSSFVANARKMYVNSASMSTTINTVNSGGVGFGPHQVGYKPAPSIKSSAKSRDPRIKISTSYAVGPLDFNKQHSSSRNVDVGNEVHDNISQKFGKQKSVNFHTLNSRSVKRQRNESPIGRDLQNLSSRGGWLEDDGVMKHINNSHPMEIVNQTNLDALEITSNTRQRLLVTNTNETVSRNKPTDDRNMIAEISLPSLLKGIAVNPTILMQLLKDQQRLAAESQQKTANFCQETSSSSVNTSTRTAFSPDNTIKVHEIKEKPAGNSQTNPQVAVTGPQHEAGVLRMKPRDPRRILHNNITRNIGSLNSEHFSITNQKRECSTIKKQGEQAQTSGAPSQTAFPPDILSQLNKKLTNVPDIMSTKPIESVVIPQNYSQLVPIKSEGTNISQGPLSTDQLNNVSTSPSANPWGDVDHLLEGYDEKQKAVFQKERARRIEEQSKMFSARKLCLVLDLDHTLLNSAKFSEVDQLHDDILKKKEEQDREKPQRHLFRFQHMGMWTKLRPGIWNFLEKASRLFELHLYTMGNNLYATEMAKVLDPTGTLFSGRVISKGDDNDPFDSDDRVPKSKDLEGVLGMESAVVIIDDSIRVWPHHKLNLIVVERYTYFPSSRRQFGLLGPSLLEIDHDERPEEGTLASSLAVIEKIHQNFFAHPSLIDIDVRNILASEQRKILSGCRIVFSRIFPVGEANPHLHPLWQTAEQFGAVCTNQIDDQVTHVVANSLGTDKVNWALSTGRFVVHPGWVEASALLYRRASEVDFAVKL